MLSRLDDKRTGAIIIVMQRVHMDDLTGFVTSQSDEWEVLNLAAIAEVDEVIPISDTDVHQRRVGEALSPVREPLSVLENMKLQLGSDAFSAQYQQMPVPPGGAIIKRHWIKRYAELPLQRECSLILQSWDTASKGGPENDFSVCTTWFISHSGRWYLIDVWRKRVDYPELKAAVRSLSSEHAANRVLVEDTGAGTSLVQKLLGEVDGILAVKPDCDKTIRMSVVSAKFESGRVFLPERASWLADFEAELFAFPGSRHDDQCDSVSQALRDDNCGLPMVISAEALAGLQDSEAMDAALCRPLRVKLAVVDRPTFAQAHFKDNQRQTDVSGPDRQGHSFCFVDNGEGGDWRRFESASACFY